jgi:hypothetical protein
MVVTKDRVLIEIGSTGGTEIEASITETIPKAEARYRAVAGFNFSTQFVTTYVSGEQTFTLSGCPDSLINDLKYGDLLEGTGVPSETYITNIDTIDNIVTVNNEFTADGTELFLSQNIEYWPVISAIITYLISKTTANPNVKDVISKSVGPLRYSFDKSALNMRYGLPESLVQAIPHYTGIM